MLKKNLRDRFFSDNDLDDDIDDDDDVDDGSDNVVGGLGGGGDLRFLRAQTREARTPLGVRQYSVNDFTML
jgi:hypothetical protein